MRERKPSSTYVGWRKTGAVRVNYDARTSRASGAWYLRARGLLSKFIWNVRLFYLNRLPPIVLETFRSINSPLLQRFPLITTRIL